MNAPRRIELPLPRFVFHPLTSLGIGVVHLYLAAGHWRELAAGDVQWTHIWKGFGALAGAYIFAALALRGWAARSSSRRRADVTDEAVYPKGDPI